MEQTLKISKNSKEIKNYYEEIKKLYEMGQKHEGAVAPKFANLLDHFGKQVGWRFSEQYKLKNLSSIQRPDGAFTNEYAMLEGIWEAKDDSDALTKEVKAKFDVGYPRFNIMFWQPKRIIVYQNNKCVFDEEIENNPDSLVQALKVFFEYERPHIQEWRQAVEKFKEEVPRLSAGLLDKISEAKKTNKEFIEEFKNFKQICQESINPNISNVAIDEMLIQHMLTRTIIGKIFNVPGFFQKNVIAKQLEKLRESLSSHAFSEAEFLGKLEYVYKAIIDAASDITDFSEKQSFLNTVYEKFFQGWAIKTADKLGIVYTPQPVVDFMVRSVQGILQNEFGKSLSSENVHIIDPFVGTGNFIMRVMQEIYAEGKNKKESVEKLRSKYIGGKEGTELHCNEIQLMPYYIASLNIEHEYYEKAGEYVPFEGICFADTFQMFEDEQFLGFMQEENVRRVKNQRSKDIFVVICNPPYNAHQMNENDNNKNRSYPELEREIRDSYSKDSRATLRNALSDPYVKAIKWASKRIGTEGIVAMITNNSFVDGYALDGMRKHLEQDFDKIYVLDLKGNIRKDSMKDGIPLGEKHTVFGLAAMVGISISFFVKKKTPPTPLHKGGNDKTPLLEGGKGGSASVKEIWYFDVPFRSTREEKFEILEKAKDSAGLDWRKLEPNKNHTWLTEGMAEDFEKYPMMGDKEQKGKKDCKAIFRLFSNGVKTNRDIWAINFSKSSVSENMRLHTDTYNFELDRYLNSNNTKLKTIQDVDDFIQNDDNKIKWDLHLKNCFKSKRKHEYSNSRIRKQLYRPFTRKYLYYDMMMNAAYVQFGKIFPNPQSEKENRVICLTGQGSEKDFMSLIANQIPDLHLVGAGCSNQSFPFYTYSPDGTNRQENVTDWALELFREHYGNKSSCNPPTPLQKGSDYTTPLSEGGQGGEAINLLQKGVESAGSIQKRGDLENPLSEGVDFAMQSRGDNNNEKGDTNITNKKANTLPRIVGWNKQYIDERTKSQNLKNDGKHLPYRNDLKETARKLRSNQTKTEKKLWYEFLSKQDIRFTRQHPIDNFIVDFYSSKLGLVIEIDGETHNEDKQHKFDTTRTEILERYGLKVVRFSNEQVLGEFDAVCSVIGGLIGQSSTKQPPNPPSQGGQEVDESRQITKWDIFYYIYAMLHHPSYREDYKENLRRSLPRVPFAKDFWKFAEVGKKLADIHINYEQAEQYDLGQNKYTDNYFEEVDYTVDKMRLSTDKTELIYNDSITLGKIPPEVFDYKLGNRSALEWIVDQYRVKVDSRSGIVQDPNGFDGNPRYIFELVGKIVTVSLETVRFVKELSKLEYK
ncbi:MAG TPA: DUF559 domain-containing protein [Caldisericia bacterium]|nr:DUF559 domain-containing protein [Caldisericia bacterium]HRV75606.1 DUF559 domain-containing protein [Caldisericia bacterium]